MSAPRPPLRLARVSRNVSDLQASTAFYCGRLGFCCSAPYRIDPTCATWLGLAGVAVSARRLWLGDEEIELVEVGAHARPYPAARSADDLWFQHLALRQENLDAAYARLIRADIDAPSAAPISNGVVTLPARSGGVRAFKFRDPDGHPLELIAFPAQGPQQGGRRTPSGIDHSAICVTDVMRSVAYYRDTLGCRPEAWQVNHGGAQAALDALRDPVVEVVALQPAAAGPHLELLAYRTPAPRAASLAADPGAIASDRLVFEPAGVPAQASTGRQLRQDPDGHYLVLPA